ncbi:hypothetical protein K458DRAFT_427458 [Lentithecium fluviatile CBS 122367]|uniref:Uncharacterized protein n=1 Tax=Lentithecium fluviatile CBS 122367 TaxID=1168545 RepID=A0A6G1JGA4_9PLEO|nr:hypothetical protein K458DRAFT_427458 [Lentithecium fluviatile CBS 122367]
MATAPSAPVQQDVQNPPSSTHSLDNLQAMMNLVLISSGHYLTAPKGVDEALQQLKLKKSVVVANERFHDSLDVLEAEIRQAQTVLRRDLALLKADRKKREAAAKEKEAEKARLAAESSMKKITPPTKEESPVPPAATQSDKPATSTGEPPSLKREMEKMPPSAPEPSAPAEDVQMENADIDTTNNPDTDFDFDALFGESVMDSAGDDENNQEINMDTSGPDLNFTLDESAPSLLRGLEDFAKAGDDDNGAQSNANGNLDMDFTMTDVPDMHNHQSSEQTSTSKPVEDTNVQPTTTNDDLNLDTMTTDNLDDLFDLDYENPEATQFDDAFFGFGES